MSYAALFCRRVTVFTLFPSFVVLQEGAGLQLPPQKEDEAAPEENQGFCEFFSKFIAKLFLTICVDFCFTRKINQLNCDQILSGSIS
jgi:hypothetical protein